MNQQDSCNNNPTTSFLSLGVTEEINGILAKKNFTIPTPIQEQAIPIAITGRDLIGIAQTGTGKTLAFALPIIQKLMGNKDKALVLAPTRELAWQVEEVFRSVTSSMEMDMQLVTLIGGVPIERQRKRLKKHPRVIIATPGRLQDHLKRKTLNLTNCQTVVLDEADRMFDIGFAKEIIHILSMTPKNKQTLLFSATMPKAIRELINNNLKDPASIEIKREKSNAVAIAQELCVVQSKNKAETLGKILKTSDGQSIIFARTKMGTKKLARTIYKMGYDSAELHSDRSMAQRKRALDGFRNGKYQVLVATDIAARGIDVSDIELVVNYDLPQAPEDYVHRIGRTGRAGKSGRAISFAMPDQISEVCKIEKVTSIKFDVSDMSLPFDRDAVQPKSRGNSRNRRRGGGRSRSAGGSRYGGGSKSKSGGGSNRSKSESGSRYGKKSASESRSRAGSKTGAGSNASSSDSRGSNRTSSSSQTSGRARPNRSNSSSRTGGRPSGSRTGGRSNSGSRTGGRSSSRSRTSR